MTEDINIPEAPEFTTEQLERCRESGDYNPILFEWYKYVGIVCNFYASIRADSPGIRAISPLHYAVLIGLLNRCSRLMLANVALSHQGLFGETTAIIDRCIFESAVKSMWICSKDNEEIFNRFIASGLKTELELKGKINKNKAERNNKPLVIEQRMLDSINDYILNSNLTEEQIASAKKLPDLATMIDDLGHDKMVYIAGQRIGSAHVHGTWSSLWMHYLEKHEDLIVPRDHDCATHINQFIYIPLIVLEAIDTFVKFAVPKDEDAKPFYELLESIGEEIHLVNDEVVSKDFELTNEI